MIIGTFLPLVMAQFVVHHPPLLRAERAFSIAVVTALLRVLI
jgi:hypothetical protein